MLCFFYAGVTLTHTNGPNQEIRSVLNFRAELYFQTYVFLIDCYYDILESTVAGFNIPSSSEPLNSIHTVLRMN